MANHLPIITELALLLSQAFEPPMLDFRQADWSKVNADLAQHLEENFPAARLTTVDEFLLKVDDLVRIIKETLEDHLKERRPSPFIRRWWTKELSILKKIQNHLSGKSYRFRHIQDHPAHAEHKAAAKQFKSVLEKTHNQDWVDWLESVTQQDLYIANKYITNEPSDDSSARVPTLKTVTNGLSSIADNNESKTAALADSIFLPPPSFSRVSQDATYPPLRSFSRARISSHLYTQPIQSPRAR